MPPTTTWSTDIPTKPGCYWFFGEFKEKSAWNERRELLFVRIYCTSSKSLMAVSEFGVALSLQSLKGQGHWMPIEEPEVRFLR